jgi:hypothetical protein
MRHPAVLALGAAALTVVGVVAAARSDARPAPLGSTVDVTWEPAAPFEGSLVRLQVAAAPGHDLPPGLSGTLAGEPLHFEPGAAGTLVALAAVPLGARDTVWLRLARGAAQTGDTTRLGIPVVARALDREQLRVAPRFVRPPDSALAARLARERRLVTQVLHGTHARPRLWTEPFREPRVARITSPFGQGREFNADSTVRRHRGTDFDGNRGDPVYAANRGLAALVADLYYAGTAVYVDHGAGLVTAYLHLDRAAVATGDTVARGQLVGLVGATGRVTGPHLHWAALYGRLAFDPLDLLALTAPGEVAAVEAIGP